MRRERVVVVGGGFGGLNVTRTLNGADVDITLVDRTNHHLFQPLLYQVATGILPPGLIAPALRSVIKKQHNARALLADVHDLDLDAQGRARAGARRPGGGPALRHARRRGRRHALLLRQGRLRRVRARA